MACKSPAIRWTKQITPAQVRQLIRGERDAGKALLIFDSASAEYPNGYRHDLATFALVASRLAAANLLPAAESLLPRAARELGLPTSDDLALPIIRAYARARKPLDALRVFRQIQTPTHRSFTAALAALVAGGRLPLARTLFARMRASGVPITVPALNVVIKALCTSKSPDAALRLLRQMPQRGCTPDACTYGTIIDGLCKLGRVDEARGLFKEMDCSPNVVTYTSLIHGLCCSGCLDEALELFEEMGKRGIAPNVVTYSSLIDGLCKGGRSLKALAVMEQMVTNRLQPNMITYSSLINGLCKEGRIREALEVLDRMRLQGRKPDAGLYGKIIIGLCDLGRFREAANYLDEMVLNGVVPNRVTWSLHIRIHNTVARGLCAGGGLDRAFQLYKSMYTRGISTEPETFGLLVVCYCKIGDVHKAARIVDEMLVEGCVPELDTWNAVLGGYWDRRKVREAAELMWVELMNEFCSSQV